MGMDFFTFWPQYAMIILFIAGMISNIHQNCSQPEGKFRIIGTFIGVCLQVWLLYAGGFWRFG